MGTVYLVRHGQASFGAANYDQLSPLGTQQCVRLGEYFRAKGLSFDAALVGTPDTLTWPGLNEYDSKAVLNAIHPEPLERPKTPEAVRRHFRLLRQGLAAWMAAQVQPEGMPSYADFVAGIVGALDHVREQHVGRNVLIVSSGGPISTLVGQVLGMAPEATIELNLRIRNSSVSELTFNDKKVSLLTYNTLPHLDTPEHTSWVTYT
jgi:broad specificity phosphatase PhoE